MTIPLPCDQCCGEGRTGAEGGQGRGTCDCLAVMESFLKQMVGAWALSLCSSNPGSTNDLITGPCASKDSQAVRGHISFSGDRWHPGLLLLRSLLWAQLFQTQPLLLVELRPEHRPHRAIIIIIMPRCVWGGVAEEKCHFTLKPHPAGNCLNPQPCSGETAAQCRQTTESSFGRSRFLTTLAQHQ